MAELEREPAAILDVDTSVDARGVPTIRLAGDLDISNVKDLDAAVASVTADPPDRLVIDVSDLRFMDSAGIAVLLRVAARVPTVQLRNPSKAVRRVIEVTGLTGVLAIEP
jgi:anti-sigma B factor antagonist